MTKNTYALHIGLNKVNPIHYRDCWEGTLSSCEADALAMMKISKDLAYSEMILLLTAAATRTAFFDAMTTIGKKLKAGDLFVITFSGHGGQILDTSGDEADGFDETLAFYDGEVSDDEINALLKTYPKGACILFISDSCHSGSLIKNPEDPDLNWGQTKRIKLPDVTCSVRLISGCQDHQESKARRKQGVFTNALLSAWDDGNFKGNYADFYETIIQYIPYGHSQLPNHLLGGAVNEEFDNNQPFVV